MQRLLQKQGIEFKLGTKVKAIDKQDDGSLTARLEPNAGGDMELLDVDVALVAVGRRPYTGGLGLEAAGVALDEPGHVRTDAHYRTNVPGIYAIGDVVAGVMLAHKAEDEGIAVAEIIAGQAGHVNYGAIPSVMYTDRKSPGSASPSSSRPRASNTRSANSPSPPTAAPRRCWRRPASWRIAADVTTDRILGAQIVSKNAGEIIHELVVAMEFSAAAEDVARTTHAHPTLSEAVREAALMCGDGAIHI